MVSKIYIGTSGFNYKHWSNDVFYPQGLSPDGWLSYYSGIFSTVEINVSFYRLLNEKTIQKWEAQTPRDFSFAVKGSRYITHTKRLSDVSQSLILFSDSISEFATKLEVILWQFPSNFKQDKLLLISFCEQIKKDHFLKKKRHAFEFRNDTWFTDEIYEILHEKGFALCIADSSKWPKNMTVTASFVYIRLHEGHDHYGSNYSPTELVDWAKKIKVWSHEGMDVYVYFNNDAFGFAPKNAKLLTDLVSRGIKRPS